MCQSEKKVSGVEWNSVSDKGDLKLGQRLRITHTKVHFPYIFLSVCVISADISMLTSGKVYGQYCCNALEQSESLNSGIRDILLCADLGQYFSTSWSRTTIVSAVLYSEYCYIVSLFADGVNVMHVPLLLSCNAQSTHV